MRRKRLIEIAVVTIVVVILCVLALPLDSDRKEPEYNGKPLHAWLHRDFVSMQGSYGEAHDREVVAAIHHMSSNALPLLLEWMQYEPVPWREKAGGALARTKVVATLAPTLPSTIAGAERKRLAAESFLTLRALHPDPVAVTNQLYQMLTRETSSPELKMKSAQVLANVGRDNQVTLPLFLKALESSSGDTRAAAAHGIYNLGPTFVGLSNPAKQLVTPALVRTLSDRDSKAVLWTLNTFLYLSGDPSLVLPPLTNLLSHTDPNIRRTAEVLIRQMTWTVPAPPTVLTPEDVTR